MVRKYVRETEKTPTPEVLKAMSRAFAIRKKSGKRKTFPRGTWTEATEGTSIRPQVLARHTSKHGTLEDAQNAYSKRNRQGDHLRVLDKEFEDDLYRLIMQGYQASVPVDRDWLLSAALFIGRM